MRYFAGNSLAAFFRSAVTISESTTAGRFDSAFVSNSILIPSGNEYIQKTNTTVSGTNWFRFDVYVEAVTATSSPSLLMLLNGTTNVFRFIQTSASVLLYQSQFWNGSTWTNTGGTFSFSGGARTTVTVKIIPNNSFEVYLNGVIVTNGSGWSGGSTSFDTIRLYNASNTLNTFYSQIMWADYDLRDSHLKTTALDGNSAANTGGASGVFGDINETVLDEGTAVVVSTTTNKAGFSMAALTVPVGYIIAGLVVSARGRVGGSITDGKLGVRGSSGTNSSGSGLTFNGGYEPRCRILETDPDTAAKFTQAGYNAAEVYLEAV